MNQRAFVVACVSALFVLGACSGDDDSAAAPADGEDGTTTTAPPRPEGPAAELSELTGGNGVFIGSPGTVDLDAEGYVQEEYAASGSATSYTADGELGGDGRWTFVPGETAPYETRILVRRPSDPDSFSGTVVLEWLNVSGGVDADPEWTTVHEEILRRGHAWVGVSAQRIGVMGGPVLVQVDSPGSENQGKGLVAIDPARYGSLEHPGDGFSFDLYTQVARGIRAGDGIGALAPQLLVAAGESQSAFAMVTYYNGVQPLTRAFDGFFVHSRGASGLPLVAPGGAADIAGGIASTPTIFRTDLDTPVLDVQSETDVTSLLNSYAARQDDDERFRLWEVAGTAHFDQFLLGPTGESIECTVPINNGPMHVVAKAGFRALTTWIETAEEPPTAPRLEVTGDTPPQSARDDGGIALGGLRTPPIDVPIATLSGEPGPSPSTICLLLGTTTAFSEERLAALYPSAADYERQYEEGTDAAIDAGFVLEEDRQALLDFADPSAIPG